MFGLPWYLWVGFLGVVLAGFLSNRITRNAKRLLTEEELKRLEGASDWNRTFNFRFHTILGIGVVFLKDRIAMDPLKVLVLGLFVFCLLEVVRVAFNVRRLQKAELGMEHLTAAIRSQVIGSVGLVFFVGCAIWFAAQNSNACG